MQPRNDAWLDDIEISSPCSADWNAMTGDERQRFCEQCSLDVYDFSALSRTEAEALVQDRTASGERLCARFRRRADGTVLTRDCPVGLRTQIRRTASRVVAMLAAAFTFLGCRSDSPKRPGTGSPPEAPTTTPIQLPPQLQGEVEIMGDIAIPEFVPAPQPGEPSPAQTGTPDTRPPQGQPQQGQPQQGQPLQGRIMAPIAQPAPPKPPVAGDK